jgi:broad specificity phosphatase PhoE
MEKTDTDSDITLWVVRHGYRIDFSDPHWRTSAENPYNPPLAPVGFEQAAETGELFKSESIDHIIASPFLRTIQTANIIAEKIGKKVILEAGLSEWLTGRDFDYRPKLDDPYDLVEDYPFVDPVSGHLVHPEYPEDRFMLDRRIKKTLTGLIEKYGSNLLLISHGSPIRSIFKVLVNYEGEGYSPMCSVSKFHYQSGNWKLEINSDSDHLTHPDNTGSAFYKERWADLAKSKGL